MSAPSLLILDHFMANQSLASGFAFDRIAIESAVKRALDLEVVEITPIRWGSDCLTMDVELSDATEIIAREVGPLTSIMRLESEVATMQYLCQHFPEIPAPVVLYQDSHLVLMEKMPGVLLSTVWETLSLYDKRKIVKQVAEWNVELFNCRFEEMGSLYWDGMMDFFVGPMTSDAFCAGARGPMELDRGPWRSTTDYFYSCAQRELDLARSLDAGNASKGYKRMLSAQREAVERSMDLLIDIVTRCRSLDEDDPELAPFAIDLEDVGPRNLFVDPEQPSKITGVIGWQGTCVRPLWMCAHLPKWISPSLCSPIDAEERDEAEYLADVFRRTAESLDPLFVQAMDADDIRTALEEVARMDAVQDAFLILPTLESLTATLPGEEDLDGLEALLNPLTLAGRAVRINLVTTGRKGTLALADMSSDDFIPLKIRGPSNVFGSNILGLCMDIG
ncbi:hypothetical protein DACRYDRAFT_104816 [Dacryopinax primogenitus]|uniref:Altered inheritance of mitochondria protein 9, mitochondrial n=1 Tax=Dacryopinax primogenitus (strain DJM 731) TaxID=1858805 RepID=M5GG60_DACPD|nr:uncharacterized protein DACRYDRAFT_104816 [Dacryopinax primogenitus]EJU04923.1 hypothetical protein DACRYDRAFT_104816 [Dacryopinax primogenitus]